MKKNLIPALLIVVSVCFLAARQFIHRMAGQMVSESITPAPRANLVYEDIKRLQAEPFEITTSDRVVLRGWWIPSRKPKASGTVIILHGHLSNANNMAWHANQMAEAGFNAVVYDARAHGMSGGNVCSFGIKEAEDARLVANHIRRQTEGPVFLWGISMGAAVGAQALANDTPFSAGVLFAPFADLDQMVITRVAQRGLTRVPGLTTIIRGHLRDLIGVDATQISPEAAAANIHVPVLVVHGSLDDSIPVDQGRAVFDALPEGRKEWLILPEAGHNDLVEVERPWGRPTIERVITFFQDVANLSEKPPVDQPSASVD